MKQKLTECKQEIDKQKLENTELSITDRISRQKTNKKIRLEHY